MRQEGKKITEICQEKRVSALNVEQNEAKEPKKFLPCWRNGRSAGT